MAVWRGSHLPCLSIDGGARRFGSSSVEHTRNRTARRRRAEAEQRRGQQQRRGEQRSVEDSIESVVEPDDRASRSDCNVQQRTQRVARPFGSG
eukprot:132600-Pleurochrysis_carterae.AAC.1